MKVTNITRDRNNNPRWAAGALNVTDLGPTHIEVAHFNEDAGFFWYKYDVTGTPEEIAAVKSFCDQLTAATGAS